MAIDLNFYKDIFKALPLGLFVIDKQQKIVAWNDWMKTGTGLDITQVENKALIELYPDGNFLRFEWALEQIFTFGAPQVLSQALNNYLVPMKLGNDSYIDIDFMQQHVMVLPIPDKDSWLALVVIEDVTVSVHQKNTLMSMGHKLEEEGYRDALTGIYNRRFLWDWLNKQISHAQREETSVACCMLDIDFFKKINDVHGHSEGDRILVEFTNHILSKIRQADVFIRYGGEEFVIIMPGVNEQEAEQSADRIRGAWELYSQTIFSGEKITCSIGVSIWTVSSQYDAETLVNNSDKALYEAKESGRNCVKVFT
jgi:diguanylate cyclase (GGDEF)-like protein